jgi:hypothetical protein
VLDHTPSTSISITDHSTAKFLRVGPTGGAHRRIKIVWSRCQSNAGCYQGNDDGDVSYFDHHQLRYLSEGLRVSSLCRQAKGLLLPRSLVRIDQSSDLSLERPYNWLCRAVTVLIEIVGLRILNMRPNHARLRPNAGPINVDRHYRICACNCSGTYYFFQRSFRHSAVYR